MSSVTSSSSPASSPTFTTNGPRRTRVTPEHTLTRVRENQRRHRARRKNYIAELEQKLAETQQQLSGALAEIAALKAERQRHDSVIISEASNTAPVPIPDSPSIPFIPSSNDTDEETNGTEPTIVTSPTADTFLLDTLLLSTLAFDTPASDSLLLPPGPPPCCQDPPTPSSTSLDLILALDPSLDSTTSSTALSYTSPECSTCHTRPAPAPTESTTLCAQAYVLIQQQNFRGIDAATIRLWLYQGYRRARKEGEGCRVENGALFRLLDFISGV